MKALVTGAGARLGQAMAVYLGQRGYDVAVHFAESRIGAQDTVARLAEMGRKGIALQADLLDEDAVQALVGRAADALGGPLTCLVNNAPITPPPAHRVFPKQGAGPRLRPAFALSRRSHPENNQALR